MVVTDGVRDIPKYATALAGWLWERPRFVSDRYTTPAASVHTGGFQADIASKGEIVGAVVNRAVPAEPLRDAAILAPSQRSAPDSTVNQIAHFAGSANALTQDAR